MADFQITRSKLMRLFAYQANEALKHTSEFPSNDVRATHAATSIVAARVLTGIEVPSRQYDEFPLAEDMELSFLGLQLTDALRNGYSIQVIEDPDES